MKGTELKGKEIYFDTNGFDAAVKQMQNAAEQANEVVTAFNEIETLGKFTLKTWEKIQKDNGATIVAEYQRKVETDLKNFSVKSIRETYKAEADKAIQPLLKALDGLDEGLAEADPMTVGVAAIPLTWQGVKFSDGKFIADIPHLRQMAKATIENEDDATLYRNGQEIEKLLNEMLPIFARRNIKIWDLSLNSVFSLKNEKAEFNKAWVKNELPIFEGRK